MSCSTKRPSPRRWGRLQDAGIAVALFIDPDMRQIEMAKVLGAKSDRDPNSSLFGSENGGGTAGGVERPARIDLRSPSNSV